MHGENSNGPETFSSFAEQQTHAHRLQLDTFGIQDEDADEDDEEGESTYQIPDHLTPNDGGSDAHQLLNVVDELTAETLISQEADSVLNNNNNNFQHAKPLLVLDESSSQIVLQIPQSVSGPILTSHSKDDESLSGLGLCVPVGQTE